MNVTKTLWVGENEAVKGFDEHGYHCDPRLIDCVISMCSLENGISIFKTGKCDGFTVYTVTASEQVWDRWENFLKEQGYL